MAEPISAYDLARDLAKKLAEEPQCVEVSLYGEEAEGSVVEYEAALVIEPLIVAALRNGGIKP